MNNLNEIFENQKNKLRDKSLFWYKENGIWVSISWNEASRQINILSEFLKIIDYKIKLGLPIDQSVCVEFQNNVKSKNFVFSEGIDFIYEFFNYDNFYLRPFSKKLFNLFLIVDEYNNNLICLTYFFEFELKY